MKSTDEHPDHRLFPDPDALASICRKHRIKRLSLFGSILNGTAGPDSDVDLLVEFEPGATPGFFGLAAIEEELSTLLGGRTVDLRTAAELSRYFREQVLREAEVQYAA
jgi:predicted nucleotidyltransferase